MNNEKDQINNSNTIHLNKSEITSIEGYHENLSIDEKKTNPISTDQPSYDTLGIEKGNEQRSDESILSTQNTSATDSSTDSIGVTASSSSTSTAPKSEATRSISAPKKGYWYPDEDKKLTDLVESAGQNIDWASIASKFDNRSAKQCRERWNEYLSPTIDNSPFTLDEDVIILRAQARLGNKWKEIAEMLPVKDPNKRRTPTSLKVQWHSLERKMRRVGSIGMGLDNIERLHQHHLALRGGGTLAGHPYNAEHSGGSQVHIMAYHPMQMGQTNQMGVPFNLHQSTVATPPTHLSSSHFPSEEHRRSDIMRCNLQGSQTEPPAALTTRPGKSNSDENGPPEKQPRYESTQDNSSTSSNNPDGSSHAGPPTEYPNIFHSPFMSLPTGTLYSSIPTANSGTDSTQYSPPVNPYMCLPYGMPMSVPLGVGKPAGGHAPQPMFIPIPVPYDPRVPFMGFPGGWPMPPYLDQKRDPQNSTHNESASSSSEPATHPLPCPNDPATVHYPPYSPLMPSPPPSYRFPPGYAGYGMHMSPYSCYPYQTAPSVSSPHPERDASSTDLPHGEPSNDGTYHYEPPQRDTTRHVLPPFDII